MSATGAGLASARAALAHSSLREVSRVSTRETRDGRKVRVIP